MIRQLRLGEPGFPPLLREIPGPPRVLFAAGLALENAPVVAVVGTRKATAYGLDVAHRMAYELATAGIWVASGMAVGIDAAAHTGALDAGGVTIAVLGTGVDLCYPRRNRRLYRRISEEGLLLSELACGTGPKPYHFPARNRIIAGIASATVVVESLESGGAMITARNAGEFGRSVFAVPGPVHSPWSEGTHLLLRDGALIARRAADVLEDLGMAGPGLNGGPDVLDPDERRVMSDLDAVPCLLEVVAGRARIPPATAAAILTRLELKGLVTRTGGRFGLTLKGGRR